MPDEEIIRTKPTAHGYLASRLSEHIAELPDGGLLVTGCPIARTGFQEYAVRDLPREAAKELGIDVSNPSSLIDLYRPPEEVFSPRFLASLEGRPITDGHPPDFITPATFSQYAKGHIQNVRRGPEPLDDGEWPILADLIISGEPLVSKVKAKQARDISLGYDFSIDRDGDKVIQCDMVGNHSAVVPKGRAGDLVAIGAAAPPGLQTPHSAAPQPAPAGLMGRPPGSGDGRAARTDNAPSTKTKEKLKVKSNLLHLLGLGLKAKAADSETDPEELAQAALDIGDVTTEDKRGKDKRTRDRRSDDDLDPEIEETGQVRDRHGRDRRGRDLDPEIELTHTEDRRGVHDALDKIMDAIDGKRGRDRRVDDSDIAALRDLLDDFLGEEAKEPEHAVEDDGDGDEPDPSELEEVLNTEETTDTEAEPGEVVGEGGEAEPLDEAADGEEAMECAHCGSAMGGEACPECGCRDAKAKDRKSAKDRATAHDGAAATLRMLRPMVARSKDEAVKAAYNTALATLKRGSRVRAADAGYGAFIRASRTAGKNRPSNFNRTQAADTKAEDVNSTAQAIYDRLHAGKAAK